MEKNLTKSKVESYPQYMQLRDKLKERILNREFSPGQKLPTERELALNYNVGRMVIRQAFDSLAQNGTILRLRGCGTYLNPKQSTIHSRNRIKKTLGFLLIGSTKMSYVCEEIIRALSDELSKDNNNLLVMSMASSVRSFDALPRAIREKDIDGLFMLGDFCKEIINMISEHVPVMLVGKYCPETHVSSIYPDNITGISIAFKYLLSLGHRHIGYFGGPVSHTSFRERFQGYKQMLEDHGMNFDDEIININPDYDKICKDKIRHSLKKVSAVICDDDSKATLIINICQQEGIKVPEELSIISFDDTPLTFLAIPTLTSVSYNKSELALLAVKYLYGDMQKINSRILVPVKLMVRESTSKIGESL